MEEEMIKSLEIRNFQSHVKTELEFSNGVNVIVGSSDSGKTAIIRALRWACWNRPSGNAICSSWGGDTNVVLETEEGIVWRHKGKEDWYEIKLPDRAGSTFKAFGTAVPQEIASLLNINEINLQGQLDAPFLLSDSAGEVAAHFNRIARLDKIDTGTQNVNAWLRELNVDIKYKQQEEQNLKTQLARFADFDKFEAQVEVLEMMEKAKKALINQKNSLDRVLLQLKNIEEEIASESHLMTLEPLVLKLTEEKADRATKFKEYQALSRLLNNLSLNESDSVKTLQTIERLEKQWHDEMPEVCPLCGQKIKK
jgi:DNA repair protein SbcC/Rad50